MAPKESRLTKLVEFYDGNLWFHKKSNIITLGITVDGLESIGEAESINLPAVGDDFSKDDSVLEVDGTDNTITVHTPAAGFVTEVNEALIEDISILNEDPIDEGWLVKIEMEDGADLTEYL